jgi:hypothetical protein
MIANRRDFIGLLAAAPATVAAKPSSVVRLKVGDRLPRFDLIRTGKRSYLISSLRDGHHIAQNIWQRQVEFKRRSGKLELCIRQHWDGVGDTPAFVERESWFEMGTFRPSSHTRITTRQDKKTVEGFLFGDRGITGLPNLTDNVRADFSVDSDEPMYNFETDMEMLQALPWARGYAVSIPLFHPAVDSKPARYLWSVIGDEALVGPAGLIDCWVVKCDYNSADPPTRFWLTKSTQQLIKMESPPINGVARRKTLLY